jgi:glycosidase
MRKIRRFFPLPLSLHAKSAMIRFSLILLSLFAVLSGCNKSPMENSNEKTAPALSGFPHPGWSRNANIYEVNLRQYSPEGTFAAFEAHLPRLREMGVDILWFMPIQPIGVKNRKGSLGSYYSIQDYTAVNPDLGTLEEWKALVVKAHEMGFHVLLDWVANHTAWDNVLIEEHPDWYTHDSLGNIQPPVPDWSDVADLNYEQEGLRKYMIDALGFWVRETNIDGFRCDMAGMVPTDFWEEARISLDSIKPVFMLAEWEDPGMHASAFDMSYGWVVHHLMKDIAQGKKGIGDLDAQMEAEFKTYPTDAYRMYFTSNHDENSWQGTVRERLGEAAEVMAVLSATLPGMPLIYSGQEAGLDKRLAFFEKDEIEWKEHPFANLYKSLFRMKKEHECLWNGQYGGDLVRVENDRPEAVYSFIRKKGADSLLVLLNLSGDEQTFSAEGISDEWRPLISGRESTAGENGRFSLGPWGYLVME